MLIVDDLLLWLPAKGVMGIFKEIQKLADRELTDREALQEKLLHLQMQFELDEITEEEYAEREAEILDRLNAQEEAGVEG
ncbi:MAG: gas vesicle protein GvpG [Nitrospinota bacterium]